MLAFALGCSHREPAAPPPRWATVAVPECHAELELPGTVTREVETADDPPTILYETAGDDHLLATCIAYPPDAELPIDEEVLRGAIKHQHSALDDLAGGIESSKQTIAPDAHSASYELHFRSGQVIAGTLRLAGRELANISAIVSAPGGETALERAVASYHRLAR